MAKRRPAKYEAADLLAQDRLAEIEQITGKTLVLADPQRVINEAIALAHSDITDVLGCATIEELKKLPEHVRRAISSVTLHEDIEKQEGKPDIIRRRMTVKMHQKIEPLKLLAMMTKLIDLSREQTDAPNAQPFTGFTLVLPDKSKPKRGAK